MQKQPLPFPVVRAVLPTFLHMSVLHNNAHRLMHRRTYPIVWDKFVTADSYEDIFATTNL